MKASGEQAARSVLGPVSSSELGITLTHEHLLFDGGPQAYWQPDAASERRKAEVPISLGHVGWIRFHPHSHHDNYRLLDIEEMIGELRLFAAAGGRTIVDATSIGPGRDLVGLAQIARNVGVNIIAGTSYYTAPYHPPDVITMSELDLTEKIVEEVVCGARGSGIRPGVIGEVGCSWPLQESERKVLRASAVAQRRTGAPLMIHPGPHPEAPFDLMKIIVEGGGNPQRTIISHVDARIPDQTTVSRLAETGCYLSFDLFGRESSHEHPMGPDFPNDATRIRLIRSLINAGFLDKILVSQDICFKTRLVRYGGHGYAHMIHNVLPLMSRMGVTREQIEAIMIENPKQVLSFDN